MVAAGELDGTAAPSADSPATGTCGPKGRGEQAKGNTKQAAAKIKDAVKH
jgi:hypothetical protein